MSVGAGSIKRAAKAAKTEGKANPTEEVKVVAEKVEAKAEAPKTTKKPAAEKKAETKPAAKKTTTKKANTKTTKAVPKAEAKKSAYNSGYEAYGVGQQLPVYLM